MSTMNDPWTDRLSERLDGTLPDEERSLLEAHLVTCGECRATLVDLEQIVARARALPELAPGTDLWPMIESQVAALAQQAHDVRPHRPARMPHVSRGITLSWPQLAAAGLLLVALSGGGVWFAGRGTRAAGKALSPASNGGGTSYAAAHQDADPAYAAEVAELEKALHDNRAQLDPTTVKTIEANLKIIDLATTQARQALAADPANPYLKEYLSKTMRKKVELLKQATVFASTQ